MHIARHTALSEVTAHAFFLQSVGEKVTVPVTFPFDSDLDPTRALVLVFQTTYLN